MSDEKLEGLRILHLEDDLDDARWVQNCLAGSGIGADITVTSSRDDFQRHLEQQNWDLVLSDFAVPSFGGRSALALVQQRRPEIPFIFISGTLGEDVAVEIGRASCRERV